MVHRLDHFLIRQLIHLLHFHLLSDGDIVNKFIPLNLHLLHRWCRQLLLLRLNHLIHLMHFLNPLHLLHHLHCHLSADEDIINKFVPLSLHPLPQQYLQLLVRHHLLMSLIHLVQLYLIHLMHYLHFHLLLDVDIVNKFSPLYLLQHLRWC